MLANETSLKRGAVMSLMAALLQALIAIALVGAAGFVFQATASQITHAADWIELASYCGVAAIGAWLVWRKGSALVAASERTCGAPPRASPPRQAYFGVAWRAARLQPLGRGLPRRPARRRGRADGRMRARARPRSG